MAPKIALGTSGSVGMTRWRIIASVEVWIDKEMFLLAGTDVPRTAAEGRFKLYTIKGRVGGSYVSGAAPGRLHHAVTMIDVQEHEHTVVCEQSSDASSDVPDRWSSAEAMLVALRGLSSELTTWPESPILGRLST